jgi:hypothetical protein
MIANKGGIPPQRRLPSFLFVFDQFRIDDRPQSSPSFGQNSAVETGDPDCRIINPAHLSTILEPFCSTSITRSALRQVTEQCRTSRQDFGGLGDSKNTGRLIESNDKRKVNKGRIGYGGTRTEGKQFAGGLCRGGPVGLGRRQRPAVAIQVKALMAKKGQGTLS